MQNMRQTAVDTQDTAARDTRRIPQRELTSKLKNNVEKINAGSFSTNIKYVSSMFMSVFLIKKQAKHSQIIKNDTNILTQCHPATTMRRRSPQLGGRRHSW